jgi:hypothetical protein
VIEKIEIKIDGSFTIRPYFGFSKAIGIFGRVFDQHFTPVEIVVAFGIGIEFHYPDWGRIVGDNVQEFSRCGNVVKFDIEGFTQLQPFVNPGNEIADRFVIGIFAIKSDVAGFFPICIELFAQRGKFPIEFLYHGCGV